MAFNNNCTPPRRNNGNCAPQSGSFNRTGCHTTSPYNTNSNCDLSGPGAPCRAMFTTAVEEKDCMTQLNDRLAAYINRVRNMKQHSGGGADSPSYLESVRLLECEILKLKDMYENELAKLRSLLDEANRDRAALAANADRNRGLADELNGRLANEAESSNRCHDEMARMAQCLAQKDKENADLKAALQASNNELNKIRPDYACLKRDLEDLRNVLECEKTARASAEEKLKQLCDQLNFDSQVNGTENADLKERLRAAGDIIMNLENKIKGMGQGSSDGGPDLAPLLQMMREGTAAELRRSQQETEEALNKNLSSLQCQIDADAKARDNLARINAQLEDCIKRLEERVSELEGQLAGCEQHRRTLNEYLDAERAKAKQMICDLERRLQELKEMMLNKIKECNSARDMQLSLQAEIGAYQTLLTAEETRVSQIGTNAPSYGSGGGGRGGGPCSGGGSSFNSTAANYGSSCSGGSKPSSFSSTAANYGSSGNSSGFSACNTSRNTCGTNTSRYKLSYDPCRPNSGSFNANQTKNLVGGPTTFSSNAATRTNVCGSRSSAMRKISFSPGSSEMQGHACNPPTTTYKSSFTGGASNACKPKNNCMSVSKTTGYASSRPNDPCANYLSQPKPDPCANIQGPSCGDIRNTSYPDYSTSRSGPINWCCPTSNPTSNTNNCSTTALPSITGNRTRLDPCVSLPKCNDYRSAYNTEPNLRVSGKFMPSNLPSGGVSGCRPNDCTFSGSSKHGCGPNPYTNSSSINSVRSPYWQCK